MWPEARVDQQGMGVSKGVVKNANGSSENRKRNGGDAGGYADDEEDPQRDLQRIGGQGVFTMVLRPTLLWVSLEMCHESRRQVLVRFQRGNRREEGQREWRRTR